MIIIIDGGPRSNMNTAQMLQKFSEEDLQKAFEAGLKMAAS